MKYKYLIFDLDGTLINSTHKIMDVIEDYFLQNYSELFDTARYYIENSQGQSLQKQLTKIFGDEKLAHKETKKIYKIIGNLRDKIMFFPGIPEKIKQLSKNYKLFLTTGSSTKFATQTLKDGNIIECFEKILGSDEILKGKQHLEIFEELSGDPDFYKKSLYIGDGNMDKIFARESNIDFLRIGNRGEENEDKVNSVLEIDKYLK